MVVWRRAWSLSRMMSSRVCWPAEFPKSKPIAADRWGARQPSPGSAFPNRLSALCHHCIQPWSLNRSCLSSPRLSFSIYTTNDTLDIHSCSINIDDTIIYRCVARGLTWSANAAQFPRTSVEACRYMQDSPECTNKYRLPGGGMGGTRCCGMPDYIYKQVERKRAGSGCR